MDRISELAQTVLGAALIVVPALAIIYVVGWAGLGLLAFLGAMFWIMSQQNEHTGFLAGCASALGIVAIIALLCAAAWACSVASARGW